MGYFASEMQKDWRAALPGLLFDRHFLLNNIEVDGYTRAVGTDYISEVEAVLNNTKANIVHGCPLIRCKWSGGGAASVVYNTYVAGGAGSGISTDGCFLNFCGISAFQTKDNAFGQTHRQIMIAFPSLTAAPANGAILTQAVSLASGEVIASSTVYNYVIVRDLNTGTWTQGANAVTDSGLTMIPAAPVPRGLIYASYIESNADMYQAGAGIWAVIRGYTPAFVQGDDAGVGFNGDVADCTPLSWNDDVIALVAANYHALADLDVSIEVPVNPDNVIAHAMQVADDNSAHLPEIIIVYVRADEPLVYAESNKQGVDPTIQRG